MKKSEKLTKESILKLRNITTSSDCWLRIHIYTRPVIWVYGHKYFLSRVVCHLWHGLDLNDESKLACHKCNNDMCFNPEHLYVGTYSNNLIDAVNSKSHGQVSRIYCKLGHFLDGIKTRKNGLKERYCKSCQKLANIRHRGY